MMDSSAGWNSQDPTLSMPQDDFQQFLDMGISSLGDNIQFDFGSEFTQQGAQGMDGQDTTMQESMPSMTTASNHPTIPGTSISGHPSNDSLLELDQQIQYLQHQRHQQQQRQIQEQQRNFYAQNRTIPPTPTSMEMHTSAPQQFYPQQDQQQQNFFETGLRIQKEQEVSESMPRLHTISMLMYGYRWPSPRWYRPLSPRLRHILIFQNIQFLEHTSAP
jgi:hypothetical protein